MAFIISGSRLTLVASLLVDVTPVTEGHHRTEGRTTSMELILGLVIICLLTFVALLFAKSRKQIDTKAGLTTEQPGPAEEGAQKPVNKANMDQPQEEFIEPEGAHATTDEAKR